MCKLWRHQVSEIPMCKLWHHQVSEIPTQTEEETCEREEAIRNIRKNFLLMDRVTNIFSFKMANGETGSLDEYYINKPSLCLSVSLVGTLCGGYCHGWFLPRPPLCWFVFPHSPFHSCVRVFLFVRVSPRCSCVFVCEVFPCFPSVFVCFCLWGFPRVSPVCSCVFVCEVFLCYPCVFVCFCLWGCPVFPLRVEKRESAHHAASQGILGSWSVPCSSFQNSKTFRFKPLFSFFISLFFPYFVQLALPFPRFGKSWNVLVTSFSWVKKTWSVVCWNMAAARLQRYVTFERLSRKNGVASSPPEGVSVEVIVLEIGNVIGFDEVKVCPSTLEILLLRKWLSQMFRHSWAVM